MLSIYVFGQDTIRYDIRSSEIPNPYWYEYSEKNNTLKIASGISFATGGTLLAIGFIRSAANSAERGFANAGSAFVNVAGSTMSVAGSYLNTSQLPAWDPVDPQDFNYNDSRSTKQYFISGSVFVGLGVILTLIDDNSGSTKKQNSKKLYRLLSASSTRDGVGLTCKF